MDNFSPRAEAIAEVVNARRPEPVTEIVPQIARGRTAARIRLIATAAVFAALWVALVWWRALP